MTNPSKQDLLTRLRAPEVSTSEKLIVAIEMMKTDGLYIWLEAERKEALLFLTRLFNEHPLKEHLHFMDNNGLWSDVFKNIYRGGN